MRRGELTPERAMAAASLLMRAGVWIEPHGSMEDVLARALALDHPAYDCEYLLLAERLRLPFVTADLRFARKVRENKHVSAEVLTLDDLA